MFVFGLTKSFKRLPTSGGCISNILNNGYFARYNTKVENFFFNRKRELVEFRNAFNDEPQLHTVLGPPSTGKTALVRQVTTNDKNFSPLFIDCRTGQFDTPTNVYNSIESEFRPFIGKHKDFLKKIMGSKFSISYDRLEAGFNLGYSKEITSVNVRNLLNDIKNCLPKWTIWNGHNIPSPILIIDEANMFSQLGDSDPTLLKSILNWMVLNTKQENRFNIVLTSSDSFFLNWIVTQLHIPHVTPYVVGDLSKEEAEEYFEKHVLPYYECKELEGKFDHVCRIAGTRMRIIKMYVKEYTNKKGKLEDDDFSIFRLEDDKLSSGLDLVRTTGKPAPLWNRDDLIKVMENIVEAEDQGYILETDLVNEIGREKVISLITYDILHRRPTNNFANDIINPPKKAILTAMNKPSIRAMERILHEISSNKK